MRTIAKVLCAVLLLASALSAAGPVLVITDAGYQVMTTGPSGAVLSPVTPVGQVMDLRTGAPKPPDTTPPDVGSDPIAKQVQDWANGVNDPTSRQALAEVYKRVGAASAGQSRDKVTAALKSATDSVLGATGGTEKWKGFRGSLSGLIDAEEAKAPINWPVFCASVAKGLDGGTALDPALLQLIIQLIMQIIQLFMGGFGGGGV